MLTKYSGVILDRRRQRHPSGGLLLGLIARPFLDNGTVALLLLLLLEGKTLWSLLWRHGDSGGESSVVVRVNAK